MDGAPTHPRRVAGLARRALARAASPRSEKGQKALLRATMASAAVGVTDPIRFAGNELFLRRRVRSYRIRRSGRRIFIRHPASDAWVVHEVLGRGVYRPPPEAEQALRTLGRPLRIVDLGAHVGSATLLLLELFPDALVRAYEPSPETAALLRRTIGANGLSDQCEVHEVAAGAAPGSARIEGYSLLSHLARDGEELEAVDLLPALRDLQPQAGGPVAVDVVDVLPALQDADLLKMDIEGAEWSILGDPRFAALPLSAVVLEYHPQGAPAPDATEAVRTLLAAAGFTVGEPFDQHHGVGLVWAWRE